VCNAMLNYFWHQKMQRFLFFDVGKLFIMNRPILGSCELIPLLDLLPVVLARRLSARFTSALCAELAKGGPWRFQQIFFAGGPLRTYLA